MFLVSVFRVLSERPLVASPERCSLGVMIDLISIYGLDSRPCSHGCQMRNCALASETGNQPQGFGWVSVSLRKHVSPNHKTTYSCSIHTEYTYLPSDLLVRALAFIALKEFTMLRERVAFFLVRELFQQSQMAGFANSSETSFPMIQSSNGLSHVINRARLCSSRCLPTSANE